MRKAVVNGGGGGLQPLPAQLIYVLCLGKLIAVANFRRAGKKHLFHFPSNKTIVSGSTIGRTFNALTKVVFALEKDNNK